MAETLNSSSTGTANDEPRPLTTSQRALTAARLARQLTPDAKKRQKAGTKAPEGAKGKSAAKAAIQFGVSTRLVELALRVLENGVRELVQSVEDGTITLSLAAKLASHETKRQGLAVAEIIAGRPVAETLAAAGIQDREPLSFDDKTLTQALAQLRKLLDLRASAFGPNDAYRAARDHLDFASKAVSRWRTGGFNESVPLVHDARGRRAPLAVVPAFQTAEDIKIVCAQFDALAKQIEGLTRRPGGDLIQTQYVVGPLQKARKILWDAQAVEVCTFCSGTVPTCSTCRGRGWLPVTGWRPATS
jgi:hypothetical protein